MSKKLKIGIIGTGGISHVHLKGYASVPEKCEVVAFCDIKPDVLKAVSEKYGPGKTFLDYRDLLREKDIDAVSVCTPNNCHMQLTVDALNAGKHVLCEKPMGMNAAECKRMCAAAKKNRKNLQIGLQTRFSPAGRFMSAYIEGGGMGDVYYARAQALRRRGVPGWGVFIDKVQQGGGPLIDIGVHILDFTLFLMGYPKPVSASGKTWDTLGKDPDLWNGMGDYDRGKFTVEDFAVGLIKFANGATVTLESSFMGNMGGNPFQTQLYGTKAGAIVKPYDSDPIEIFT
ncbi:MAG TPA: Gfo/Idh/MocA family oxidoreductase, partial [Fimbriimonadaceae bacterium]|nr:Gfo/Idh/MocA family oxidoreductase [Fimbriimonadaceae bacterium]